MSGQAKPPSRFTRVFASTFRIVRTDAAFFGAVWAAYVAANCGVYFLSASLNGQTRGQFGLWLAGAQFAASILLPALLYAVIGMRMRLGDDSRIDEILPRALRLAAPMAVITAIPMTGRLLILAASAFNAVPDVRAAGLMGAAAGAFGWVAFMIFGLAPAALTMRERGALAALAASERLLRGNRWLLLGIPSALGLGEALLALPATLPNLARLLGGAGNVLAADAIMSPVGAEVYLQALNGLYAVLLAVALWHLCEILAGRSTPSAETLEVFD